MVSYAAFVFSSFDPLPHLSFFWCLWKVVLGENGISWVSSLIQLIFVISKSKGLSEILWDIHTSTYQICRIEKKINRTTTFHKWIFNLTPEDKDILKILWKREIAQFLLFSTIFCYLLLDFHVKTGTRFSLRDKQLFEISKVEITKANCISIWKVCFSWQYLVNFSISTPSYSSLSLKNTPLSDFIAAHADLGQSCLLITRFLASLK